MNDSERFLADKKPVLVSYVNWWRQRLDFEVASYLDPVTPPARLVTSVRGVVRYNERVVDLENEDGRHFLPGGRPKPEESFDDALMREIREECGLTVDAAELLGFLHFRHLQPRPDGYAYPYPEMFHLIYGVTASGELRQGDADGYETGSYLYSPSEALMLPDTEPGHPFLQRVIGMQHEIES